MSIRDVSFWIELFKNIITIVAAIIGAIVAILGLRAWRRQLQGKTEYEISKDILKSVYTLVEAIKVVRNPFVSSGEINSSLKDEGLDLDIRDDDYDFISTRIVFHRRWKMVSDALSSLSLVMIEAKVILGNDIDGLFLPLNEQVRELWNGIDTVLRSMNFRLRDSLKPDELQIARSITYGIHDDGTDKYSNRLKRNVEKIEEHFQQFL